MARLGSLTRVLAVPAAVAVMGLAQLPEAAAGPARTGGPGLDWPQFLHDPQHSSVSSATAFTPANAASAHQVWHWQPPVISGEPAPVLDATPTVVPGWCTSARRAAGSTR